MYILIELLHPVDRCGYQAGEQREANVGQDHFFGLQQLSRDARQDMHHKCALRLWHDLWCGEAFS